MKTNIDLDKGDPEFTREILRQPGGEEMSTCFTCRTCSASCPITAVNRNFNPVRIIRLALYGLREEVLGSEFLWLCSSCYACQERCPQGVCITDLMTVLKNMAVKAGYTPQGIRAQRDIVAKEGRIYPLDDFDNKKRNKIGLPALPTTCDFIRKLIMEE
jgi:heterodisulfide reductase subunit C